MAMRHDPSRIACLLVVFLLVITITIPMTPVLSISSTSSKTCGTTHTHNEDLQEMRRLMMSRNLEDGSLTIFSIPIVFHVVMNSTINSGGWQFGRVNYERILKQVDHLNRAYAGEEGTVSTNISFKLQGVQYYTNSIWFSNCGSQNSDIVNDMKLQTTISPERILNVWTCEIPPLPGVGGTVLGYAEPFPPYFALETNITQGIVLDYRTFPDPDSWDGFTSFEGAEEGDVLVHEIGHYLGLFHTFENGCKDGDLVLDTPAQLLPGLGDVCRTLPAQDSCPGQPGLDPVTNYMDFSDDSCLDRFTNGQAILMRSVILIHRPTLAQNQPLRCVSRGTSIRGGINTPWKVCTSECFFSPTPGNRPAPKNGWCRTSTTNQREFAECCCGNDCTPNLPTTSKICKNVKPQISSKKCGNLIRSGCLNLVQVPSCPGKTDGGCRERDPIDGTYCNFSCETVCKSQSSCIWESNKCTSRVKSRSTSAPTTLSPTLSPTASPEVAELLMVDFDVVDSCWNYDGLENCGLLGNREVITGLPSDEENPNDVAFPPYVGSELGNEQWVFRDRLRGARFLTSKKSLLLWEIRFAHDSAVSTRTFRWVVETKSATSSEIVRWLSYELVDGFHIRCVSGNASNINLMFGNRSFVEVALSFNPITIFSSVPKGGNISLPLQIPEEFKKTRNGTFTKFVDERTLPNEFATGLGFAFIQEFGTDIPILSVNAKVIEDLEEQANFINSFNPETSVDKECVDWWTLDPLQSSENFNILLANRNDITSPSQEEFDLEGYERLVSTKPPTPEPTRVCKGVKSNGCPCFSELDEEIDRQEFQFFQDTYLLSKIFNLAFDIIRERSKYPLVLVRLTQSQAQRDAINAKLELMSKTALQISSSVRSFILPFIPSQNSVNASVLSLLASRIVSTQLDLYTSVFDRVSLYRKQDPVLSEFTLLIQEAVDISLWEISGNRSSVDSFLLSMDAVQDTLQSMAFQLFFIERSLAVTKSIACDSKFINQTYTDIAARLEASQPLADTAQKVDRFKILLKGTRRMLDVNTDADAIYAKLQRELQETLYIYEESIGFFEEVSKWDPNSKLDGILEQIRNVISVVKNGQNVFLFTNPLFHMVSSRKTFEISAIKGVSKMIALNQTLRLVEPVLKSMYDEIEFVYKLMSPIATSLQELDQVVIHFQSLVELVFSGFKELAKIMNDKVSINVTAVCKETFNSQSLSYPCAKLTALTLSESANRATNGDLTVVLSLQPFLDFVQSMIDNILNSPAIQNPIVVSSSVYELGSLKSAVEKVGISLHKVLDSPFSLPSFEIELSNLYCGTQFDLLLPNNPFIFNVPWFKRSDNKTISSSISLLNDILEGNCTSNDDSWDFGESIEQIREISAMEMTCNVMDNNHSRDPSECSKLSCEAWCSVAYETSTDVNVIPSCIQGCTFGFLNFNNSTREVDIVQGRKSCETKFGDGPSESKTKCQRNCGNFCDDSYRISGKCLAGAGGSCCFGFTVRVGNSYRACADAVKYMALVSSGVNPEQFLSDSKDCNQCLPTPSPTSPTKLPTEAPTKTPTLLPSASPTASPFFTARPTSSPLTNSPTTSKPTFPPIVDTSAPSVSPTALPTSSPSGSPSKSPTLLPSESPTLSPSGSPTLNPTLSPSKSSTLLPSESPTLSPSGSPTLIPTFSPTLSPSKSPTLLPSESPTLSPSGSPTLIPTFSPTLSPTKSPTVCFATYGYLFPPTQSFDNVVRIPELPSGSVTFIVTGAPVTPSLRPAGVFDFDGQIFQIGDSISFPSTIEVTILSISTSSGYAPDNFVYVMVSMFNPSNENQMVGVFRVSRLDFTFDLSFFNAAGSGTQFCNVNFFALPELGFPDINRPKLIPHLDLLITETLVNGMNTVMVWSKSIGNRVFFDSFPAESMAFSVDGANLYVALKLSQPEEVRLIIRRLNDFSQIGNVLVLSTQEAQPRFGRNDVHVLVNSTGNGAVTVAYYVFTISQLGYVSYAPNGGPVLDSFAMFVPGQVKFTAFDINPFTFDLYAGVTVNDFVIFILENFEQEEDLEHPFPTEVSPEIVKFMFSETDTFVFAEQFQKRIAARICSQFSTSFPTLSPTFSPTASPTMSPTLPTEVPTQSPTEVPTESPTEVPTQSPTEVPTEAPTESPTEFPP